MPRLISTRSLVTSLPSTTTPGLTNALRPQSVMCSYLKSQWPRVVERAPADQQRAPQPDVLVAGQRLVEEVEQVVVQRHDALHELDVAHQPGQVVGEQLDRRRRADAARVERGRVDVPALHQAEHLARVAADLQRLAVEVALERVERPHDVADGAVAVVGRVRRLGVVRPLEHAGVGLLDHPLAEVHADQVLLEDVVVEHVLGGLAEVDDPLARAPAGARRRPCSGCRPSRSRGCRRRSRRCDW